MDKKTLVKKPSEKRTQYPIGSEHYTLYEEIGQGVSALVYRALCIPLNDIVAIKILDFERDKCDLDRVSREAQIMVLVDHPNVLKSHCSFVCDRDLWVVMPYMAGGSCLHILKAAHPDGLEEVVIATVLREVLKGLDYLHNHGYIHRDVKAGNVLIDSHGGIKLGDFGVSAYLFDSGDRQRMRNTFVGTPCWMAPEVMEQLHGYDFKADIWSFGITALELAHGHAPFSKYPPMKVLLMTLQNAPPGLDYERDKKFSKSFRQLIASCLVKDPLKRPSAKKLLKHSFFKQARSNDYIARKLLEGLPALGDRIKELKRKEEDMLAQKKMPDGQKEEISQNEYKRGISSWNFDLEDLKAQASLLPDEEIIGENDQGGSTNLPGHESQRNQLQSQLSSIKLPKFQHQFSFGSHTSDATGFDDNNLSAPPSPVERTMNYSRAKYEKPDDDLSIASSFHDAQISQNSSPSYEEVNCMGKGEQGAHAEVFEGMPVNSCQSCNGPFPQAVDELPAEVLIKLPRTSAGSSEDIDEKTKYQVVQQRGRFKVTSENVDLEKVTPEPPTATQPLPPDGDSTANLAVDAGSIPSNSAGVEKSFLEAVVHDREKVLLRENADLRRENSDIRNENVELRRENSVLRSENGDFRRENADLRRENADLRLRQMQTDEELQKYKAENKSSK